MESVHSNFTSFSYENIPFILSPTSEHVSDIPQDIAEQGDVSMGKLVVGVRKNVTEIAKSFSGSDKS